MSVNNEKSRDPRVRLVRDKYFSIRPRPLERWLWSQGIPASAERVFWIHWQEGVQRGDWCSEIPLKRVARECNLDVSTVTRAYQLLAKMGCIRRTDPGRDPGNPFQQATAVTEVRVPRELLLELERHPNRQAGSRRREEGEAGSDSTGNIASTPQESAGPSAISDPLAGLKGRERVRALAQLTEAMSQTERDAYQDAMRLHHASMPFDVNSKLTEEARAVVQQVLTSMATVPARPGLQESKTHDATKHRARSLSVFELARLKREIQTATSSSSNGDLMTQVVWSIEKGALRRFSALHAIHIALKKIREGAWTRPHRMPPNWSCTTGGGTASETCRAA